MSKFDPEHWIIGCRLVHVLRIDFNVSEYFDYNIFYGQQYRESYLLSIEKKIDFLKLCNIE